jgi:hypothetical protein
MTTGPMTSWRARLLHRPLITRWTSRLPGHAAEFHRTGNRTFTDFRPTDLLLIGGVCR